MFPEMVAGLRAVWDEAMPFPELARSCDDLNRLRVLGLAYAFRRGPVGQRGGQPGPLEPEGSFSFVGVADGVYRLVVSPDPGQYVEDIVQNGTVDGAVADSSGRPRGGANVALVPMTRRGNVNQYRIGLPTRWETSP